LLERQFCMEKVAGRGRIEDVLRQDVQRFDFEIARLGAIEDESGCLHGRDGTGRALDVEWRLE